MPSMPKLSTTADVAAILEQIDDIIQRGVENDTLANAVNTIKPIYVS